MNRNKIGFIGCGKMAQAIINGIVKSSLGTKYKIFAYDVNEPVLKKACSKYKINKGKSNADIIHNCEIIILAVKPQNLSEVIISFKEELTSKHILISIAAGASISKIQKAANLKIATVRVMPNTPALVGEGAAGYSFSKEVKKTDKKIAHQILSTFCKVMVELPESQINTVTALSGSGPAYVFYFAEAMIEAAKQLNFDSKKAKILIAQTFIGAAKLMMSADEEPDVLRLNVTSKGGTTERAIGFMDKSKIKELFTKAVILAKEKADELGK